MNESRKAQAIVCLNSKAEGVKGLLWFSHVFIAGLSLNDGLKKIDSIASNDAADARNGNVQMYKWPKMSIAVLMFKALFMRRIIKLTKQ